MKKISLFLIPALLLLLTGCPDKDADAPKIQKLQLNSSPAGATVHVTGKTFTLPYDFKITPGTYLFRIEKPGYAVTWFSCRVQPDGVYTARADKQFKWTKLSPARHTVPLQKQGGTVLILSKPEAARVEQNGRVLGATPLVLTDQPVGKHTAQLKAENYAEAGIEWEIRNSRPVIIRKDLFSNIGQIQLNSDPAGARLFIGGSLVGQTPYKGTWVIGKHDIRLERDGYLPYEGHITVNKGKLTTGMYQMTVSPGALTIASSPAGAQVFINDKLQGSTPLELQDLSAGSYKIALTLDGYDQVEEIVEVAPGSKIRKEFTLANSRGGIELDIFPAGVKVYLNGRAIGTVEQGDSKTQTRLITVNNLSPGTYYVKAIHKRANAETRKIVVQKGQITRPKRIELWVPNAEIVWQENGKTELGMIYGESDKIILFGPAKGIRYEIDKTLLKSIKFLDINE